MCSIKIGLKDSLRSYLGKLINTITASNKQWLPKYQRLKMNFYMMLIVLIGSDSTTCKQNLTLAKEDIFNYMGWKNFTFVNCHDSSLKSAADILKIGSAHKLQICIMKPDTAQTLGPTGNIVVEICDDNLIDTFSHLLSLRRPSDSTLALVTNSGTLAKFKDRFSEFSLSKSFYRITQNQLFHHVTLRMEKRLLEHKIDCKPHKCTLDLNSFSYQGAVLYGKAKTWSPWFVLEEKNQDGVFKIKTCGVIQEFMDIVSARYNFTLVPDPATEWGSFPVSGDWTDPNATFSGIFNDAVQGNTDVVLSFYSILADRHSWVDSSFAMYQTQIQFLINSQVQVPDLTMMWKPLTLSSWILVIASSFLLAGGIFLPRKLIRNWNQNWYSCRVAVITGWLLFNLISAHYNGALTMFLSSTNKVEITSLNDGLDLYPKWKMVVPLKSNLNFLVRQNKTLQVQRYLTLVSGEESHLVPNDYGQAMKLLMNPGHFMYSSDTIALSHEFEKNSGELQGLVMESVGNDVYTRSGLLLPKYSPHTRMINSGDS